MTRPRFKTAESVARFHGRFPRSLLYRITLLAAGNLLLLAFIAGMLKEGASFADVMRRAGPDVAPVLIAGLGMTGIICVGAIDLSIASILTLAGTVFGVLAFHGAPPALCSLACFLTALGLANLNGQIIRRFCIPAIIVTLAGLPFYRGVALALADVSVEGFGGAITIHDAAYHRPGKEFPGLILAAAVAAALVLEWSSKSFRRWLALGNSDEACRLLGLRPSVILQHAFLIGGAFFGVASLVYVTRLQAIEPARMALGFELQVIGAVVLGGTNIFGGEGSYVGTLLGAFFLYFMTQALIYGEVSAYYQEAVIGAVIITVIGVDCAMHRRQKLMEEIG